MRRWLVGGEREVPIGTGGAYRTSFEDVRLEVCEDRDVVAISFRIEGDDRLFGFRMEAVEEPNHEKPFSGDPERWAEIIVINLDEAILVGARSGPDSAGVIWVY